MLHKLKELKEYSVLVRGRKNELGLTLHELCTRGRVSQRTVQIILKEQWSSKKWTPKEITGLTKSITSLASVIGYSAKEWSEKLGLEYIEIRSKLEIDKSALIYLLSIVEIIGPISLQMAQSFLDRRVK